MKVSELTGAALDWAVAKCEGYTELHKIEGRMPHEPQLGIWPPRIEYGAMDLWELSFSTDWAQGGPIIEREDISVRKYHNEKSDAHGKYYARICQESGTLVAWYKTTGYQMTGSTPLIAAMRCYVASKLGDEIELPEELNHV